jgi:hypothetical protein
MFIPKHYDTSKSYAAIYETFNSVYPDKAVTAMTTLQQQVIEFQDRGSVYNKHVQCDVFGQVACSTAIKTDN